MAALETLEAKVDALTSAVAEMRGEMKGKLHEAPSTVQLASMSESARMCFSCNSTGAGAGCLLDCRRPTPWR